ncbi:MAG: nucleotidyltransferase domain-containing protein [Thermoprotei archaeon]
MALEELKNLCSERVKAVAVFGSYARGKDYVEGISDINVFLLSRDKEALLYVASLGYSPLMLDEESLKRLCESGDPLCFYVLKDSTVLCGSLPGFEFRVQDSTCAKIKAQAVNSYCYAIESHFRTDELNSVRYAFKALKYSVAYRACIEKRVVFASNDEAYRLCRELNLRGCDELKELQLMTRLRLQITTWALDKIAKALSENLGLDLPTANDLLTKYGDFVAKLIYDNGVWRVLLKDGHWESLEK